MPHDHALLDALWRGDLCPRVDLHDLAAGYESLIAEMRKAHGNEVGTLKKQVPLNPDDPAVQGASKRARKTYGEAAGRTQRSHSRRGFEHLRLAAAAFGGESLMPSLSKLMEGGHFRKGKGALVGSNPIAELATCPKLLTLMQREVDASRRPTVAQFRWANVRSLTL